jgi:sterol desaturase/sphingolipid hydroxylase (fatty acid hydroxylase superfamily)
MKDLMIVMGEDLQFYLFFGLLAGFLILERLIPKRHPQRPQGQRWLTNAALTLVTVVSLPLLPISFITAAWWAQEQNIGLLNLADAYLSPSLVIALTLLLRGFISFGTHYLNHKVPFLWRFHKVHHLDTELDVSSTVRFHPLETPLSLAIGLPAVLLFGLSPWVLIFYELLDVSVVLFSHSNIQIPSLMNRYLRYVIVTPDLHKVHHSSYAPETDSNFSAVFPIWDILCGTFRTATREPLETMTLGLDEVRDPQANRFWWLLASPFLLQPPISQPPISQPPARSDDIRSHELP